VNEKYLLEYLEIIQVIIKNASLDTTTIKLPKQMKIDIEGE